MFFHYLRFLTGSFGFVFLIVEFCCNLLTVPNILHWVDFHIWILLYLFECHAHFPILRFEWKGACNFCFGLVNLGCIWESSVYVIPISTVYSSVLFITFFVVTFKWNPCACYFPVVALVILLSLRYNVLCTTWYIITRMWVVAEWWKEFLSWIVAKPIDRIYSWDAKWEFSIRPDNKSLTDGFL